MWTPIVPPPLGDGRIELVAPHVDMAPDLFEYGRNPLFYRHIGSRPFATVDDARRFAEGLVADNAQGRRCYWAIGHVEDRRIIGTLGFNLLFPPAQKTLDFGYGLSPDYWGRGLFAAAARLVIGFGFGSLDLARIQVMTPAGNIESVRSVERLGFVREGVLRNYYNGAIGRHDCVVLGLLREDWLAQ